MTQNILAVLLSLAVAAAPAAAQSPASGLTHIGNAAAVRGAVKAVSEGASVGRVVDSGKPLYLNDHVTTDAAGRLQVLLLDETVFTLGPNSDMVLDTFVYDPATNSGKVDAKISKGTFRFVTGKVARKDPSQMKIKLAVGTIGVRGSIGVGETGPGGSTIINGGARNADDHEDNAGIYAQSGGKTVDLTQPGAGTHISPDGKLGGADMLKGDLDRIMSTLKTDTAKNGKGGGGSGDLAGNGGGSAGDKSGHSTAVGGGLADDSAQTAALAQDAGQTQTVASLYGGIPDGVATWDQVRTLTTGTGSYSGSGTYSCSGGSRCGSPQSGTFNLTATVDFANRTVTTGSISYSGSPLSGEPSGTINSFSYATNTGQATGNPNVTGGGSYTGTTFAVGNAGGVIAKNFTLNLHYTATLSETVTGKATAVR